MPTRRCRGAFEGTLTAQQCGYRNTDAVQSREDFRYAGSRHGQQGPRRVGRDHLLRFEVPPVLLGHEITHRRAHYPRWTARYSVREISEKTVRKHRG